MQSIPQENTKLLDVKKFSIIDTVKRHIVQRAGRVEAQAVIIDRTGKVDAVHPYRRRAMIE